MRSVAECLTALEWITKEAFNFILSETIDTMNDRHRNPRKICVDDLDPEVLYGGRQFMNDTVQFALRCQVLQLAEIGDETLAKDAAAALRYFDVIDESRKLGFTNKTVCPELRQELEGVVRAEDEGRTLGQYRGQEWWEARFYPELLGLFWALFDEEPRATFNANTGRTIGASLVFIAETLNAVRGSEARMELSTACQHADVNLPDWEYHSLNALRNKVNRWCKRPDPSDSTQQEWKTTGDCLRRQLGKPLAH